MPSEDEPLALVPGSESALDITDAQEELLLSVKDFLANRKENWAQVARWKSVLRPNYGREYANFSIDHVLDIAETEVGIISSASKLLCAFTSRSLDCTYLRNFISGFVAMGHVAGCWRRERDVLSKMRLDAARKKEKEGTVLVDLPRCLEERELVQAHVMCYMNEATRKATGYLHASHAYSTALRAEKDTLSPRLLRSRHELYGLSTLVIAFD